MRRRMIVGTLAVAGVVSVASGMRATGSVEPASGFEPGARVLVDAHNAFPANGRWTDRLTRALSVGTPVAIEQDLFWRADPATGRYRPVVAHSAAETAQAPTLEAHFFDAVKPIIERALAEHHRERWPVIVLNLDFKTNEPEHHAAVWALLGKYEAWLTTAERTADGATPAPLRVGPMLVLTGANDAQQASFHDNVPAGRRLRLFGAIAEPTLAGANGAEKAASLLALSPEELMPAAATNYRRWANFSWGVVEFGAPSVPGDWTSAEAARLHALVARAHANRLWIRFYTLNGHTDAENRGWGGYYSSARTGMPVNVNFGTLAAARRRWRAAIDAGVDFIATDQYEALARENVRTSGPPHTAGDLPAR